MASLGDLNNMLANKPQVPVTNFELPKGQPPVPVAPQMPVLQPVNSGLQNTSNTMDNVTKAIESISNLVSKFMDSPMSNSIKRKLDEDDQRRRQEMDLKKEVIETKTEPAPQVINQLDDNQKHQRSERIHKFFEAMLKAVSENDNEYKPSAMLSDWQRDKELILKQIRQLL